MHVNDLSQVTATAISLSVTVGSASVITSRVTDMKIVLMAAMKMIVLMSLVSYRHKFYPVSLQNCLLHLCGHFSFILGNLQVIIQLYRSSTINSLCI